MTSRLKNEKKVRGQTKWMKDLMDRFSRKEVLKCRLSVEGGDRRGRRVDTVELRRYGLRENVGRRSSVVPEDSIRFNGARDDTR
jgi:hypothetical protein